MDAEEDRLSWLPDCLLIEIISRLPETKYAVRTGTLSKQWHHLWNQIPNLVFMNSYEANENQIREFFSFVDKSVTQCRHLNLNKFKLDTRYCIEFESLVNKWICYAVKCNVQELHLLLRIPGYEGAFVLDFESFCINSCFTKLKLNDCQMNPSGTFRWKNLTSLSLTYVELNERLIHNILSGSPILETFKLKRCYGFSRLDITSNSLKNLVLSGYQNRLPGVHIIQVNAPNIRSLTIQNVFLVSALLLVDVSCIVKAHLNYQNYMNDTTMQGETEEDMLEGLILSLRHVKDLTVGNLCQEVFSRLKAKGFPFSIKLGVLHVTSAINSEVDLLEVSDWSKSDSWGS